MSRMATSTSSSRACARTSSPLSHSSVASIPASSPRRRSTRFRAMSSSSQTSTRRGIDAMRRSGDRSRSIRGTTTTAVVVDDRRVRSRLRRRSRTSAAAEREGEALLRRSGARCRRRAVPCSARVRSSIRTDRPPIVTRRTTLAFVTRERPVLHRVLDERQEDHRRNLDSGIGSGRRARP